VLDPETHKLRCKWIVVGFLEKAHHSCWIFRISTSQLVDFYQEGSKYELSEASQYLIENGLWKYESVFTEENGEEKSWERKKNF